ncbi:MAG: AAA family ATPase [Rhodobacteraceae bacterium]|nr:AAA family ATPase [Paracoccaceae bacterium]MYI90880.1 AAA family ATPase [Paracoccaceae bacterium]
MRLNKLHMSKYGMFSGKVLDFGERASGLPDFHIIFGLNESGKTTSLEAWLDFLFGIKRGSPYGFKHSTAMEIQATLEKENNLVEYKRIKKAKDSLLDLDDEIVPESVLNALLGGYTRPDYEILFTANDQTLEKGGNEILASKGDLGKLLFSASAGMADLSERLLELQQINDQFYRKGTTKNLLNQIKAELAELKGEWQEKDKVAADYKVLVSNYEEAQVNLELARENLGSFKTELVQVSRKIEALRWVTSLSSIQDELKDHKELPPPPQNWRTLLDGWGQEMIVTIGRLDQLSREILRMNNKLSESEIDETALDLESKVFKTKALEASYKSVIRDLPRRIANKDELSVEVANLTSRLGHEFNDVRSKLPDSATIGLIRDLMQENSGIEANYKSTEEELTKATEDMYALQAKLDQEGDLEQEVVTIESLLREIRKNDPRTLLQNTSRDILDAEGEIESGLHKLLPWKGDYRVLQDLNCPSKQEIGSKQKLFEETKRDFRESKGRKENLEQEIRKLESSLDEMDPETVTLENLAEARNRRENQWAKHKSTLDIVTAEQFEMAMRSDDQVTSRAAEQKASKVVRSDREAKIKELQDLLEVEKQKCQELEKEIERQIAARNGLFASIPGLESIQNTDEYIRWLDLRNETLGSVRKLQVLEARKKYYEEEENRFREDLSYALKEAKIDCKDHWNLETLISIAENLIERHKEIKSLQNQHLRAKVTHQARLNAFTEAKTNKSKWTEKWVRACQRTLFGESTVSAMKENITILDQLIPKVSELNSLMDRIEKMNADQNWFTQNVKELALKLGIEGDDVLQLWKSVEEHVQNNIKINNENRNIKADLENRLEEKQGLEEDLTRINKTIAEFGVLYGEKNLEEIKNCCIRAERFQELKSDEKKVLENIRETMGLPSKQEAVDQVMGLILSDLESEKGTLEIKLNECERELEERLSIQSQARRELETVSGDDSVARIKEQHENLLIDLQERVRSHLKNKYGIIALEHAIRKFRDTHKSEMMTLASQIFSKISCGNYKSLGTTMEKSKEILTVEPKEGGTMFSQDLSKGTRFQLYLALRIAGFYEIIKSNQSAPFLADDILETFDNERTAEALQVLEEMGKRCQVIYFTHHEHILDIARKVCPNVKIHTLEPTT